MRGKEEPGGLCRSLFHAPPNRAAAAELWLSASLQACSAFLDTLIFQEMISVRFLYKNLSIFKFWQSHHCCCPIAIPDPPNHFPLAFVKAEKQRNSLSRLPAFKNGHMIQVWIWRTGLWVVKKYFLERFFFFPSLIKEERDMRRNHTQHPGNCSVCFPSLKSLLWGFHGGSVVKNPPTNAGDTGSSPGPGRSHMLQSN